MINKPMTDREIKIKEIEMTIKYWQGKIRYAQMRIIENEKKLKNL